MQNFMLWQFFVLFTCPLEWHWHLKTEHITSNTGRLTIQPADVLHGDLNYNQHYPHISFFPPKKVVSCPLETGTVLHHRPESFINWLKVFHNHFSQKLWQNKMNSHHINHISLWPIAIWYGKARQCEEGATWIWGKIKTGHVHFYGGARSAASFAQDIYLFFAVCEPLVHLWGSNEQ